MYVHVDANTCDEQSTELEANKRKKKEQNVFQPSKQKAKNTARKLIVWRFLSLFEVKLKDHR
jgi:hypothetical protein